jgi:hypothetical protein
MRTTIDKNNTQWSFVITKLLLKWSMFRISDTNITKRKSMTRKNKNNKINLDSTINYIYKIQNSKYNLDPSFYNHQLVPTSNSSNTSILNYDY